MENSQANNGVAADDELASLRRAKATLDNILDDCRAAGYDGSTTLPAFIKAQLGSSAADFPDAAHANALPKYEPRAETLIADFSERIKAAARQGATAVWITWRDGYLDRQQPPHVQQLIELLRSKGYRLVATIFDRRSALKVAWEGIQPDDDAMPGASQSASAHASI